MKTVIIILSVICFTVSLTAKDIEGLNNYYNNPRPEGIVPFLLTMKYQLDNKTAEAAVYFLSYLIKDDPLIAEKLYQDFTAKMPEFLPFYYEALWRSETAEGKKILSSLPEQEQSKYTGKPDSILSEPFLKPETVDNLWASYNAAGDILFVERLFKAAIMSKADKRVSLSFIKRARSSFPFYAENHQAIAEFLLDQKKLLTNPAEKKVLQTILKNAGLL